MSVEILLYCYMHVFDDNLHYFIANCQRISDVILFILSFFLKLYFVEVWFLDQTLCLHSKGYPLAQFLMTCTVKKYKCFLIYKNKHQSRMETYSNLFRVSVDYKKHSFTIKNTRKLFILENQKCIFKHKILLATSHFLKF